jgi:putative sigma-54 modulation protein
MQVGLSGHHVEITESMRNYVNEKVGRLDRHFDQALDRV